jgi:hypothetical protein
MSELEDIQPYYAPGPVWPSIESALGEAGLYQRPATAQAILDLLRAVQFSVDNLK